MVFCSEVNKHNPKIKALKA